MEFHDNKELPLKEKYIVNETNNIAVFRDGYVYYMLPSLIGGFEVKKQKLSSWCKKWVYLKDLVVLSSKEYHKFADKFAEEI